MYSETWVHGGYKLRNFTSPSQAKPLDSLYKSAGNSINMANWTPEPFLSTPDFAGILGAIPHIAHSLAESFLYSYQLDTSLFSAAPENEIDLKHCTCIASDMATVSHDNNGKNLLACIQLQLHYIWISYSIPFEDSKTDFIAQGFSAEWATR